MKKFGEPIGITKQNVIAFSNDQKSKNTKEIFNYYNKIFTGLKYECVEFVRRWMIMVYNISFEEVDHAIDIFDLKNFHSATVPQITLKIKKISNGTSNDISFGDLIIWKKQGHFKLYGHVAVVVGIRDNIVYIGEQNIDNKSWNGKKYSRKLVLSNSNLIDIDYPDTKIIGWVKYI